VLSDAGLIKAIEMSSNADERKEFGVVLKWSRRVNDLVAEIVRHVPPFSFVRESLEKAFPSADMIVCSATPTEALEREWAEHDLRKYVKVVAGQEMGSKYHHLGLVSTGKYDKDKVIMLGDAMGDMAAAKDNGVLFYPIVPGREDASWERFQAEALDHFLAGRYAGDYEAERIAEFESSLPLHPSWLL
jgi:phosphoglycolate phosphatase-like HAD superfamily hydrolase